MSSVYSDNSFLNPGPAPRPPGARSPLSVNSNQSTHHPHHSTSSTLTSSTIVSPSPFGSTISLASNSTGIMNGGGGGGSPFSQDRRIREGWATIKEDGLKSLYWAKKYIILRELSLDFLKTETSSSPTLSVSLKDIVSVNRTDMKPYCFEVVRMASSQNGANSMASDAPRRTVFVSVKSEQELYDWVEDVYSRCPSMGGVSNPTNFTHKVHVGFDPISGGFTGLPEEWSKLLNSSAITKEDYQKNPQAVIEVLEFYTEGQRGLNNQSGQRSQQSSQQQTNLRAPSHNSWRSINKGEHPPALLSNSRRPIPRLPVFRHLQPLLSSLLMFPLKQPQPRRLL
ncbi:PBD-domain-containing protein [Tuber magnatum]|uniref:non-specific serine/threonine protein kinase n=1 Tax=Tuber magnatum TaxID=42249 RepID=A0A317SUH6_9PEZI|nr:PBD-domain-containing protein [Tuber magnatum]